ncbi:MAG: chemotaxis protein CheX [Desulfobacteraceae bacterium]|nr:chemotaxis protein CheX [Desulfobacteraceae bacterium]MCB9494636.1 chemotaxis protein CheX [Desulfobacteraceae bacterium]
MKAELVNPFITATKNVLETMAFIKVTPGKPYLKKDSTATGDVSSIVGLTGSPNGSFSISFEKKVILKIVSNMFGEEITELSDDVAEAAGEIANMVSGQARQELEVDGYLLDGSIPSVVTGENHQLRHITEGPKIAVPFTEDESGGNFTLEICYES